jgi:hypothetical protein
MQCSYEETFPEPIQNLAVKHADENRRRFKVHLSVSEVKKLSLVPFVIVFETKQYSEPVEKVFL